MEYTIKAHPTMYNGVMFRSRLEATWAAYFDLMGFKGQKDENGYSRKWLYEPLDLEGWVPDFVILSKDDDGWEGTWYVEVKPFTTASDFTDTSAYRYQLKNRANIVLCAGLTGEHMWSISYSGKFNQLGGPGSMERWNQASNMTRKKYA